MILHSIEPLPPQALRLMEEQDKEGNWAWLLVVDTTAGAWTRVRHWAIFVVPSNFSKNNNMMLQKTGGVSHHRGDWQSGEYKKIAPTAARSEWNQWIEDGAVVAARSDNTTMWCRDAFLEELE